MIFQPYDTSSWTSSYETLLYSVAHISRHTFSCHGTILSPYVTNTKYASEKCSVPLAAPCHFLGSPASPRRITVRRNKRAAHYFYESSRISPEVSEDPLATFFSTFHPARLLRPSGASFSVSFLLLFDRDYSRRRSNRSTSHEQ